MSPDALLSASGLACRRGRRLLFSQLSLALQPGALLHLRGPNGAGKTSLLRLLAGLAQPERGAVARPARLLFIGHANALSADLTLAENLAFQAALAGQPHDVDAVHEALAAFGLKPWAEAAVRTLSQGQRRRGALARLALPQPPPAWLLDEPHTALDTEGSARLDALMAAHADAGGAVLLTCHHALTLPGLAHLDLVMAA